MGWVMLFRVVVIVGVPTVLWFLMAEPPRSCRTSDDDRNVTPLLRPQIPGKGGEADDEARGGKNKVADLVQ